MEYLKPTLLIILVVTSINFGFTISQTFKASEIKEEIKFIQYELLNLNTPIITNNEKDIKK